MDIKRDNLETLLQKFLESITIETEAQFSEIQISENIKLVIGYNKFANILYGSVLNVDVEFASYEIYKPDATNENIFDLVIKSLQDEIFKYSQRVEQTNIAIKELSNNTVLDVLSTRRFS